MAQNSFFEIFSKRESIKTGKFLLGLLISFLVLNWLSNLIPLEWIELFFAQITLFFLNLFGFVGEIALGEPVIINLEQISKPIAISYLCTGLLETVIILSAVITSFGIKIQKRAIGVIGALIAIVIFNVLRIVTSILIIIFFGLDIATFSHDVLFRIFLFVSVAGIYFIWFKWATKD